MEEIEVISTSRSSATTNDVILRKKDKCRLIFRPCLVDNRNDPSASVNGTFIYQRKNKNQQWEDYRTLSLNNLKTNEWIQLHLHSAEVLMLYRHLHNLYNIYEQEGSVPSGKTRYIRADEGLISLLDAKESELAQLLNNEHGNASKLLSRLLLWLSRINDPSHVIDALEHLEVNSLQQLSSLVGITTLRSSYEIWEHNIENSNEEFWQRTFTKYSFILSQVFSHPIVILKGKAYVGGKGMGNKGGKIVDFLAQNDVSKNAVLIEIKTPKTKLLGSDYRGIYSISSHLSGAVVQVINYKQSFESELHKLNENSEFKIKSFEPSCVIIIGNHESELNTSEKINSFELFRSHLQGVEVITYDELFKKIRFLVDLLEGRIIDTISQVVEYDDTP